MSSDTDKEIKAIWRAIAKITEGVNSILAYNTLRAEIEEIVEQKVEKELKALGFRKSEDFVDNSKTVV